MTNLLFPKDAQPLKLYWFELSGHAHRVQLMLSLLKLPHEIIPVNLKNAEHKTPNFLKMNPFGQVPVLDDNGYILSDSSAILVYLATKYDPEQTWLAKDPETAGEIQRWLTVASGPLLNGPASARVGKVFGRDVDFEKAYLITKNLFNVIEQHLTNSAYLVGDIPTIADVALYTYSAHSPEGAIDLTPYPMIKAWIKNIEALPNFIPMKSS